MFLTFEFNKSIKLLPHFRILTSCYYLCCIISVYPSLTLACTFSPYLDSVARNTSIQQVNLAKGKLYAAFDAHLTPEIISQTLDATETPNATSGAQKLRAFLKKETVALHAQQKKYASLKDLILTKKISWLALESSPSELKYNLQMIKEYQSLKRDLNLRYGKILSPQEIQNALLMTFDTEVIMMAEYPDKFKKIKLVAAEDEAAKNKILKLLDGNRKHLPQLIHLIPKLSAQEQKHADSFLKAIIGKGLQTQQPVISTTATDSLKQIKNAEFQKIAKIYMQYEVAIQNTQKQRDYGVAKNLTQQKGHGILIMGKAHQEHLLGSIERFCKEAKIPSATYHKNSAQGLK